MHCKLSVCAYEYSYGSCQLLVLKNSWRDYNAATTVTLDQVTSSWFHVFPQ